MEIYWVDTSVFIEAKRKWYQFDRVPPFWAFLAGKIREGNIRCPQFIYEELVAGSDYLATWVSDRKQDGLCVAPEGELFAKYKEISAFIVDPGQNFPRYQIDEFLSSNDGWLVAQAMAIKGNVVTQESQRQRKKIRIPAVCEHFEVRWIDLPTMLDELDFRISSGATTGS